MRVETEIRFKMGLTPGVRAVLHSYAFETLPIRQNLAGHRSKMLRVYTTGAAVFFNFLSLAFCLPSCLQNRSRGTLGMSFRSGATVFLALCRRIVQRSARVPPCFSGSESVWNFTPLGCHRVLSRSEIQCSGRNVCGPCVE